MVHGGRWVQECWGFGYGRIPEKGANNGVVRRLCVPDMASEADMSQKWRVDGATDRTYRS